MSYADTPTVIEAVNRITENQWSEGQISAAAEAATRWIDAYTARTFDPIVEVRYFDGDGTGRLPLTGGLLTATKVASDDGQRAFATVIGAGSYWIEPLSPLMPSPGDRGGAALVQKGEGLWAMGKQNIQVSGTWGFTEATEDIGTVPAQLAATATQLVLATGQVGDLLKIGNEYVEVTGKAGANLTIRRAARGSTANAHGATTRVLRQLYPEAIKHACLITATRLLYRQPSYEPYYVGPGVDPDVRLLLDVYRAAPAAA